jgi:hypothetical protein
METRDTVVTDQAGMAVLAKVVACRNEIGCAARVAKQWSKPLDNPLGPKNDFDLWTGRFESRKQELINGGMAPELADEQASMEVRRSIREDGRL